MRAAFLLGANRTVVRVCHRRAKAYAMCMFLLVAAFRVSIVAIEQEGLFLPLAAGLLAGGSAAFSMLTAAAGPVLLIWILRYSPSQEPAPRRMQSLRALFGAAVPFHTGAGVVRPGPPPGIFQRRSSPTRRSTPPRELGRRHPARLRSAAPLESIPPPRSSSSCWWPPVSSSLRRKANGAPCNAPNSTYAAGSRWP